MDRSRGTRLSAVLAAGWLLWALAAHATPPDALQFGSQVRAGKIDPATFDFDAAGFWELDVSARQKWSYAVTWNPDRHIADPQASCEPGDIRDFAWLVWSSPALEAADAAQWREARSQLVARLKAR